MIYVCLVKNEHFLGWHLAKKKKIKKTIDCNSKIIIQTQQLCHKLK